MHLDTCIELLTILRDAKTSPGFTNIESNVFQGLQDIPTLTELAVLALYAQAIGKPYMRHVRSAGLNALQLGSFHTRVIQHCQAIIADPSLLLAANASAATGALDGLNWDRQDVIYRVISLSPKLPNLQCILVAFFNGALETWERFTTEFASDGTIAQATNSQRESTWISPTNDVSEGALGQCRQMLRRAPTMTDEQRNARVMWGHNSTFNWAKDTLTEVDHQFIRKEARLIDASGISQKARIEATMALEAKAEIGQARQAKALERKSANARRLAEIDIYEDASYNQLLGLRIPELDSQIDKLRETDKSTRVKSKLRNKHAKVMEILDGLKRRKERLGHINPNVRDLEEGSTGMDVFEEERNILEDSELLFNDEVLL